MRNARKVTRRRGVTAAPGRSLRAADRRSRRWLWQQLRLRARARRVGASSTWSATPPPNPSTRNPSSRPSKRPPRARASASATPSAPPATRAAPSLPGQPASVVHFSQAGDMERLVEEGELVSKDWEKQPYGGIATDSVVVLVVRKGNPKGIHSFDDLQTKDVGIVTPNPFSSGSARWNIMAVYGTAINEGKSPDQALEAVKTVLEKTDRAAGQRPRRARRLHPGRGRRPAQLRERGDQGRKGRRRRRIRRPAFDDSDRNPDRGHRKRSGAGRGRFPQVPLVRRRPGTVG